MNTMAPTIRSPPPTNCPNVCTTLPGLPVVKISRVEDTFREIRKIVVNKSKVGKKDISSTSFTNNVLKRTINAIEMFSASITSSKLELIGTIKKMTAASRYSATPMSAFFMTYPPCFSDYIP